MSYVVTLWLESDEGGWRIVPALDAQREIEQNGSTGTWKALSIEIECERATDPELRGLQDDLDRLMIEEIVMRVNDDGDDPIEAAEQEADRRIEVEQRMVAEF
jgi:hypothetical protein